MAHFKNKTTTLNKMTQVATNDLANTATSAVSSVPTIRDADAFN